MKKIKVLYDFVLFTIAEKLGFYRNIPDKLSNNPFFTAPYISLEDVNANLPIPFKHYFNRIEV
jgi:hypothetical protein